MPAAVARRPWRLTEPPPPVGVALLAAPGIRRIVAPNPGPMTYHGTNTWLLDGPDGVTVIDPGCADPGHLRAIRAEAGGRLARILVSHSHRDHLDGACELAALGGVPIASYVPGGEAGFVPDVALADGDRIGPLRVLHTPGHAMDHLCFATDDGILFSGDHVMGWSTSVVPPPPHGDLGLFVSQLERVRDLPFRLMLSGHGPAIEDPRRLVQSLLDHRTAREASIAALLADVPASTESLFGRAYRSLRLELKPAAMANLRAHLCKLQADGRALQGPEGWWRAASVS